MSVFDKYNKLTASLRKLFPFSLPLRYTKSYMKQKTAFTMIELLVVLSVIGILAAISYSTFSASQARSRDARRKTDLQTVKTALVLYKQQNNSYPKPTSAFQAMCTSSGGAASNNNAWSETQTLLTPFISILPLDPRGKADPGGACPVVNYPWLTFPPNGQGYAYTVTNTGSNYALWAALESSRDADRNGYSAHNDPTASLGKYSYLYYYNQLVPAINNSAPPVAAQNDNAASLYAVGCRPISGVCVDN